MHIRNHDFNETVEPVCSDLSPNFVFLNENSCVVIFFNASSLPLLLQAVTATRNMAHQHREPYLRLDDVEQLQRYAQSTISKHNALNDALGKARAKSQYWEREAKKGIERATGAEK